MFEGQAVIELVIVIDEVIEGEADTVPVTDNPVPPVIVMPVADDNLVPS